MLTSARALGRAHTFPDASSGPSTYPASLRRADVETPGVRGEARWADGSPAEGPPARLLCARCSAFITERAAAIEVAGAHVHSFQNPLGLVYAVRCFESAPGVRGVGEPSDYFTWFPGFAWQVVNCGGCLEHVGWRFASGSRAFFALIAERLVEGPQRGVPG